jgi:hypothetical protein
MTRLKNGMEIMGIRYEMVRGNYEQRLENAIKIVEKKFKI